MATNIARLAADMKSRVMTAIADWITPSRDDHRLTNLTADAYWTAATLAISTAVLNELTGHANATGTDSRGDTHNLDIV